MNLSTRREIAKVDQCAPFDAELELRWSEFRIELMLVVNVSLQTLSFMTRDGRYPPEWGAIGARKSGECRRTAC